MKPTLSKTLSVEHFKSFYWLKAELQGFCREHGLSSSGSKQEFLQRIELFLINGEIVKPVRVRTKPRKNAKKKTLSLDTIIEENHRCSQDVRAFFKDIIPHFHFSTYIQNYFKENVGKTYHDVLQAWYEEEDRKKDPNYQTVISSQFEYNQFIRDFFKDTENEGQSLNDAIHAWKTIKESSGNCKYKPKRNLSSYD